MKTGNPMKIASLLCALFFCAGDAKALLLLDADQGASGIEISFDIIDDENDNDQSFAESKQEIIKISNSFRRYTGIYIDRIIGTASNTPVDNGPNDAFIGPSTPIFQLETLHQYWACLYYGDVDCEPPPASRNYILPIPDDVAPGTEIRFRIQAIGPAMGGTMPFTYTDPKFERLAKTAGITSFEMLLLPLITNIAGKEIPEEAKRNVKILLEQYIEYMMSQPSALASLEEKSLKKFLREVFNFVMGSNLFNDILMDMGLENAGTALGSISSILTHVIVEGTEATNVIMHLLLAQWMEEFTVLLVIPQVEEISPAFGAAGDEVIIYGKGFDTYEPLNNRVFFTILNPNGAPIPGAEAAVIEVQTENTMNVRVPDDFYPGSVMVCTSGYCSNWDVDFLDEEPSSPKLSITSPQEGETVSGQIDVVGEITNPPASFQAAARLMVDGVIADSKTVVEATFSFPLDTSVLSEGNHNAAIEVDIDGKTLNFSVQIIVEGDGNPGSSAIIIGAEEACYWNESDENDPGNHFVKDYYLLWDDHSEPFNMTFQLPSCGGPAVIAGGVANYFNFTVYAWLEKYYPQDDNYQSQCGNILPAMQGRTAKYFVDDTTGGYLMGESYFNMTMDGNFICTQPYFVQRSYAPGVGGCSSLHYANTSRIKFQVIRNFYTCAP